MAEHACPAKEIVGFAHKERMEHGRREFYVTKVSRACEVGQSACRTSVSSMLARGSCMTLRTDAHVLSVAGPQRRIVQTSNGGTVEIIEQDWVHDLLDGYTPHILGGKERE